MDSVDDLRLGRGQQQRPSDEICWTTPSLQAVEIAVDGGFKGSGDGLLTYGVTARQRHLIDVGQLVWMPLRKKLALGIVVAERTEPTPYTLKQHPLSGGADLPPGP